jgi:hypothetical protein
MEVEKMFRDLEHPEITHALRTGYPSWVKEPEVLNDEDDEEDFPEEEDYDKEFWGDEEDREDAFMEDLFEEMRERAMIGNL